MKSHVLTFKNLILCIPLTASLALLTITTAGALNLPQLSTNNTNVNTDGIKGYHYTTSDVSQLRRMLSKDTTEFDATKVNNTIFESIAHDENRKISLFENWTLWLAGKLYQPLSRTQNPYRIADGARGLCSEVSLLFNHIAKLNNFPTRFIELNGHVISEVKLDNHWIAVDPDYGITYTVGIQELESPDGEDLMATALRKRGFDSDTIEWYVDTVQSTHDNRVTEIDTAFSPRLHLLESASEFLKWIVPICLLLFSTYLLLNSRKIEI